MVDDWWFIVGTNTVVRWWPPIVVRSTMNTGSYNHYSNVVHGCKFNIEQHWLANGVPLPRSNVTELPFFASPVTFGPRGVDRARKPQPRLPRWGHGVRVTGWWLRDLGVRMTWVVRYAGAKWTALMVGVTIAGSWAEWWGLMNNKAGSVEWPISQRCWQDLLVDRGLWSCFGRRIVVGILFYCVNWWCAHGLDIVFEESPVNCLFWADLGATIPGYIGCL